MGRESLRETSLTNAGRCDISVEYSRRWSGSIEKEPIVHCVKVDGRPLVVIDVEDRDQVERFASLAFEGEGKGLARDADAIQAALRSLIEPPKPPEPQGLGAVVAISNGDFYIRDKTTTTSAHWKRARGEDGGQRYRWADLAVVEVKSQGWSE